jgi:hypothetical protein
MDDSRSHAAGCIEELSSAIKEIAGALLHDAQAHPHIYMARLENAARRIAEAQESILGARAEAQRAVDATK